MEKQLIEPSQTNAPISVLKEYFGYDRFREHQQEIIETVLRGEDCLVLMPTGGGKSLCYQVPALIRTGIALVISPLIALMKDQVEALHQNGISAAFINSSQSQDQQEDIWKRCSSGEIRLLYLAPERLLSSNVLPFIQTLPVSMIAVDESHCISSWGHDFRPEYRQLKDLKTWFPNVPLIALTATADRVTRKDILVQLNIPEAPVFLSSFDRPNLSLSVGTGTERKKQVLQFVQRQKGQPGILYCLSRKGTEELADFLQKAGIPCAFYHAGCDPAQRNKVQNAFVADEIQVICATIAFGMGIDKSNIRWVLHFNLPNNVESFYQEIGRAGRDGLPAETLLLYSYGDLMMRLDMIAKSEADEEQKELRRAKLDRMKQYAESQVCRRRILLSYFNEEVQQDCGNCDVCQNPRKKVEASVLAQKALSGIARSGEKLTMTSLVDLLRGVSSPAILRNNFQTLPTFGVGREIRSEFWMDYLMQMLNTGVMDIAYDEGHVFKLNPRSWRILRGEEHVLLGEPRPFLNRKEASTPTVSPKVQASLDLFERLRQLRKTLAERDGVPPYMVFSDASLKDMVDSKPLSPATMMDVQGMSRTKYARYGKEFLQLLQQFASEKKASGLKVGKGVTRIETLDLYRKGMMVEEIAQQRGLNPGTIAGHLVELAQEGEEIDIHRLIAPARYKTIVEAAGTLGLPIGEKGPIQPLLEFFGDRFEGWELRLCLGFPTGRRSMV